MSFFSEFNKKVIDTIAKDNKQNKKKLRKGFSTSLGDTELAIQDAFNSKKDTPLVSNEQLADIYALFQENTPLYNLFLAANKFGLTYSNLLVYLLRNDKIKTPLVTNLLSVLSQYRADSTVSGKSFNDLYLLLLEEALLSFNPVQMQSYKDPEAAQKDTDNKLNKIVDRLPVAKLSLDDIKKLVSNTDNIKKVNPEFVKLYEKYVKENGYTLDDDVDVSDQEVGLDKDDVSVLYLSILHYFYEMFVAYFVSSDTHALDKYDLFGVVKKSLSQEADLFDNSIQDQQQLAEDEGEEGFIDSFDNQVSDVAKGTGEGVGYDNLTSGRGDTPESLTKLAHTIFDSIYSTKTAINNMLDLFHRLTDKYYTDQVGTNVSTAQAQQEYNLTRQLNNFIGGEGIKMLIPPDDKIFNDFQSYYRIKINKIDSLEKEARYHTSVLSALTKRANFLKKEEKNKQRKDPKEIKEPNYLSSVQKEIKSIRESINTFNLILHDKTNLEINFKASQKRSEINKLLTTIKNTPEGEERAQLVAQLQELYNQYSDLEKESRAAQADKAKAQSLSSQSLASVNTVLNNMSIVELTKSLQDKKDELRKLEDIYNERLDSFMQDTSTLDKTEALINLHTDELKNIEPQIKQLKDTASQSVNDIIMTYLQDRQDRGLQELQTYTAKKIPQPFIDKFNKIYDDKRKYLSNVVVPSITGSSLGKKIKEDKVEQVTNKSLGERTFNDLQRLNLQQYIAAYNFIFDYFSEVGVEDTKTEQFDKLTPEYIKSRFIEPTVELLAKYLPKTPKIMNLWGTPVKVAAYNKDYCMLRINALVQDNFSSIVDPLDQVIALVYLNKVVSDIYGKNPNLSKAFKDSVGYNAPKQDFSKKDPTKLSDSERILFNDINQLLKGAGDVSAQEKAELRGLQNKLEHGVELTPEDKQRIQQLKHILEGSETYRDKEIELMKKLRNQNYMLYDVDNVREYNGKSFVKGPDDLWYRIVFLNDEKTQYNIAKRPTKLPDENIGTVDDTEVGTATTEVTPKASYTKPGAWMHITAQGNNFLGEREGFGGQVNENNPDNPTDVGLNMSTENLENIKNNTAIENPGVNIENPDKTPQPITQNPQLSFSIKDFGNFLKALRSNSPDAYQRVLELSSQYTGDSAVDLPAFLNLLSSPELPGKDNPKATDAMEVYNRLTHNDYHRNTYQTVIKDKLIPALQNDPDIAALWTQFQNQEPLQ